MHLNPNLPDGHRSQPCEAFATGYGAPFPIVDVSLSYCRSVYPLNARFALLLYSSGALPNFYRRPLPLAPTRIHPWRSLPLAPPL